MKQARMMRSEWTSPADDWHIVRVGTRWYSGSSIEGVAAVVLVNGSGLLWRLGQLAEKVGCGLISHLKQQIIFAILARSIRPSKDSFKQDPLEAQVNIERLDVADRSRQVILHNNNFMSKQPQFIVRNTKSTPQTGYQTRRQSFSQTQWIVHTGLQLGSQEGDMTPEQKVNRLMGNLKMLQKRYRSNLKEAFQHKIKAYRLQAVVDRKMIQQAVQMTTKDQQMERLEEKIEYKERMRRLSQERALLSSYQKQEKQQYIKQRNELQKRKMSLTLYERNQSIEIQQKKMHDQIVWQELNSDRKKFFFQEARRMSQKRQLFQSKKQLLGRVMANTNKLKQLKMVLKALEEGTLEEGTFLTL